MASVRFPVCYSQQNLGLLPITCSRSRTDGRTDAFSILIMAVANFEDGDGLRQGGGGEVVTVGDLWAQAVLIPSGVLFGIVWFVSKVSLYDPQSGIRWETPHFVWDLWHTNPMVTYQ